MSLVLSWTLNTVELLLRSSKWRTEQIDLHRTEILGRLGGLGECKRFESARRASCFGLERDLDRDRCRLDFFIVKIENTLLKAKGLLTRKKNGSKGAEVGRGTTKIEQKRWSQHSLTCSSIRSTATSTAGKMEYHRSAACYRATGHPTNTAVKRIAHVRTNLPNWRSVLNYNPK